MTGLALVMAYETVAIASGKRIPTITRLSKRSKHVLGGVLLGVLALHLITTPEESP